MNFNAHFVFKIRSVFLRILTEAKHQSCSDKMHTMQAIPKTLNALDRSVPLCAKGNKIHCILQRECKTKEMAGVTTAHKKDTLLF